MNPQESQTTEQNKENGSSRDAPVPTQRIPKQWAWKVGEWLSLLFLAEVLTQLFNGFFGTCARVIKNQSSGFWHKFIDLYFASAATTELTDTSAKLAILFVSGLLVAGWMLVCRMQHEVKTLARDLECEIELSAHPREQPAENETSAPDADASATLVKLIPRVGNLQRKVKWTTTLWVVATLALLYGCSLDGISYELVKRERHAIMRIRPFITDLECHQLNRQWVMMTSRSDYRAIMACLNEYEKRADSRNGNEGK